MEVLQQPTERPLAVDHRHNLEALGLQHFIELTKKFPPTINGHRDELCAEMWAKIASCGNSVAQFWWPGPFFEFDGREKLFSSNIMNPGVTSSLVSKERNRQQFGALVVGSTAANCRCSFGIGFLDARFGSPAAV